MPFVRVYLEAGVTTDELEACGFDAALREAVVSTLHCDEPNGRLTDVREVDVHYVQRTLADKTDYHVTIFVDARRTPTRVDEHSSRSARLNEALAIGIPEGRTYAAAINLQQVVWGGGLGVGSRSRK